MLTWRTLKHELAREVATQSRGARQKPPDHEVGNTVRNDRGFVDVGIGTHKRHKRCRGDSERTQQGTCGQKTRSGVRASRWPTLPRQQSALKCTAWAQASAWAPARAGTGGSRRGHAGALRCEGCGDV